MIRVKGEGEVQGMKKQESYLAERKCTNFIFHSYHSFHLLFLLLSSSNFSLRSLAPFTPQKREYGLMWKCDRVGNLRKSQLLESHVRAQVIHQKRVTKEGEFLHFDHDELKVGGNLKSPGQT